LSSSPKPIRWEAEEGRDGFAGAYDDVDHGEIETAHLIAAE